MNAHGFYREALEHVLGEPVMIKSYHSVNGGMINQTVRLDTDLGNFFIKWNEDSTYPDLFEKEAQGLDLLSKGTLRTPRVLSVGSHHGKNYLIQEYIEEGPRKDNFWEQFGSQLAQLHQITQSSFGLNTDNHIGKLPQYNAVKPDWPTFFIENRLQPQLELAKSKGYLDRAILKKFDGLFKKLEGFFPIEQPALIHGDLWSGNFMSTEDGSPIIFDPAVYFAHREIEIAFTMLFGGFDTTFYDSYQESFPLAPNFEERVDIYNLYPLLVHVNLFGPSYLSGIQQTLKRFQ